MQLINTTELARKLSVHPWTIRKWTRLGIINASISGPGTYPKYDLDAVLAKLEANGAKDNE